MSRKAKEEDTGVWGLVVIIAMNTFAAVGAAWILFNLVIPFIGWVWTLEDRINVLELKSAYLFDENQAIRKHLWSLETQANATSTRTVNRIFCDSDGTTVIKTVSCNGSKDSCTVTCD